MLNHGSQWYARVVVAVLPLLVACKPVISTKHVRVTHDASPPAPEADSAAATKAIAKNCLMGAPVLELDFGTTARIGRPGYAVGHSTDLKIPLWVCERVTRADLKKNCNRTKGFKTDKLLPADARATNKDYTNSGFDRGHMAPAADFSHSCTEMTESFFFSNMAPQVGAGFNQHVWAYLEGRVRDWVVEYDGAWVVTGPVFLEDDEGLYCASTIGEGGVGVPAAFYKAVVVEDEGEYRAVGFILENKKYSKTLADHGDFSEYAVSIDEIEARTGIDLFSELPSNVQSELEAAPPSEWAW